MIRRFIDFFKYRFPRIFNVVIFLRDIIFIRIPDWIGILRIRKSNDGVAVLYLTSKFPERPVNRREFTHGGSVKMIYLAETFPHAFPVANLIYTVSSVGHPLQYDILVKAKQKGLQVVVNHNGVAFPAWAGKDYIAFNQSLKRVLDQADFIVYQSQFCKLSAERYLSPPDVPSEIIYNPVDLQHFLPQFHVEKPKSLTLLLGGNQYEKYRLELALKTLFVLLKQVPDARLIVTGMLWRPYQEAQEWTTRTLLEMNLTNRVIFTGPYTQLDAPLLYSTAHLLIHTKYADPSPGLIPEALACGLPVVYIKNGGVPELVGNAGIGVPVEHSWETVNLPDPEMMADAVLQVYSRINEYSKNARQQARNFSLETFVGRHKDIFTKILDTKR